MSVDQDVVAPAFEAPAPLGECSMVIRSTDFAAQAAISAPPPGRVAVTMALMSLQAPPAQALPLDPPHTPPPPAAEQHAVAPPCGQVSGPGRRPLDQ